MSSFSTGHSGLRILHVVGYLHGNDGITTHLMALTEGLRGHGCTVALASCVDTRPEYHIQNRGMEWFKDHEIPYHYVPFPDSQRPQRGRLDALRALQKLYESVRYFKPDALHLHSFSLFPYAWAVRTLTGIPIVSTIHHDLDPQRKGVRTLGFLNDFLPVAPDRMIAVNRDQEEQFRSLLSVPASRIDRIPHGIDETHFRPPSDHEREAARTKFGITHGAPTVCMIGRLDWPKGHDILIRALARLRDMNLPVVTLLAGTGEGEPTIRRLVEEEGLMDSIHFLGFADTREVLWASDVSVLPSRREIFGLVTVESMLCGVVPVRTPGSGAHEQIRDGSSGFVFPFEDDEALADRLALLLTDPARRAKMAEAALRRARNEFTADTMIDRTLALYGDVTGTVAPTVDQPSPEPDAALAGPDLP